MNVKNSAAVLEIQIDQHDPKLRVSLMVLDTALQPLFYNDLRTRQQLGYIVNSGMTELEKTLGMIFMVQSGKYDAVTLEQRIQEFLPGFLNTLAEMPEEELETLKESVINSKLQKSTSLSAEAGRLYNIAFEHDAHFDYNSEEIEAVEKLTIEDLRRLIRNYLIPERRRTYRCAWWVKSTRLARSWDHASHRWRISRKTTPALDPACLNSRDNGPKRRVPPRLEEAFLRPDVQRTENSSGRGWMKDKSPQGSNTQ